MGSGVVRDGAYRIEKNKALFYADTIGSVSLEYLSGTHRRTLSALSAGARLGQDSRVLEV